MRRIPIVTTFLHCHPAHRRQIIALSQDGGSLHSLVVKLHGSRVTCASAVIVRLCEASRVPRPVSPPDVTPGVWGSVLATPLNTNILRLAWGCRTWRQASYCFHFPFSMRSLTLSTRGPAVTSLPDDPKCETWGHFQAKWEEELKRICNSSNVQCVIFQEETSTSRGCTLVRSVFHSISFSWACQRATVAFQPNLPNKNKFQSLRMWQLAGF